MGYLNLEKKTKETIDDERWLHTGDIGWLDSVSILCFNLNFLFTLVHVGKLFANCLSN